MQYGSPVDQLISSDPTHIGPYRLIARLGAGGMGLVYLGRSEAGRTVAVKVVQEDHAQHPEFRRRFAREVAAARRVGGAWTADVLDADTEAPVPWVATQYIPGPDLTTVVGKDFGPLPEHSVRVLANRLALALAAVHEAGLIHRDLKPSNVLVTVDGPLVIDFGIARAMDSLTGDSLHTRTGMLIGSPGFMSPEQVRGLPLTPASDVFCLGAVLVHAATGRLLFGAAESGLNAHLFRIAEEEADLTGVPGPLLDLVRQCLDKDPARRPTPRQIAGRTAADPGGEWLPGTVLAQLGRHAAQLLDFAPERSVTAPAAPVDPRVPSVPVPSPTPPPPAYAPTFPVPAQGFAPALETAPAAVPATPPSPRRWWGLAVVALVQLLVLVDGAALSTAVPSVMVELRANASQLNWLFTGYGLTFGGLLLLGGHLADLVGRKRMLILGLLGFAVAAAIGGAAPSFGVLILARALEGAFAALLAPAALGWVAAAFPEPRARGRAFGIYAAVAAGGSCMGLFTSGLLSESASWRWSLYADVPLALIALLGVATLVPDHRVHAVRRFDALGVPLGCCGIAALVYGLAESAQHRWADLPVFGPVTVGVALLTAFAFWQFQAAAPLLAPAALTDRDRLGSLLALLLAGTGTFALFTVLSAVFQTFLGESPTTSAVHILPAVAAIVLGAQVSARLVHRAPARTLIVPGLLLATAGLGLLTRLGPDSGYATLALPGMLVTGLGLGMALMPLYSLATSPATVPATGGGAALVGVAGQLGGALGTALLAGLLSAGVASRLQATPGVPPSVVDAVRGGRTVSPVALPPSLSGVVRQGMLDGYTQTLWWSVGLTLLAGIVAAVLVRSRPTAGSLAR